MKKKKLIKKVKKMEKKIVKAKKVVKKNDKVKKVMHEYKEGELHSGSKKGPKVKSEKQAIAIVFK